MAQESALALVASPVSDTAKTLGDLLDAREKTLEEIGKHDADYAARQESIVRDLAAEAAKTVTVTNFVNRQVQLQALEDQYEKEDGALKGMGAKFDGLIGDYLKRDPEEARRLLTRKLTELKSHEQREVQVIDDQIERLRKWLEAIPAARQNRK